MLPTLPAPSDRLASARARVLLGAVLLALVVARPCPAFEIALDPPRARDGSVWANLRMQDPISARVEASLARGMPATFQFHAELWRKRGGWFDHLENSFDASIKIRFEVWSGLYLVERHGQATATYATLDSVRIALENPIGLPAGRVALLKPGSRYYVLVSVTLKPLSVEDIEEGEGWLTGEVKNKGRSGLGIITAIPRSLFDAVRNFSGFGDERARALSSDFEYEEPSAAP